VTGIQPVRALGLARVAVGTLWLAGLAAGRAEAGAGLPGAGRAAAAALAVRDLAQGALLVAEPRPRSLETGAVIDVLHGLSMLPVVALAPRYRRAALASAAAATGWVLAAAGVLASSRTVGPSGKIGAWRAGRRSRRPPTGCTP
jgi:hypothetical protein